MPEVVLPGEEMREYRIVLIQEAVYDVVDIADYIECNKEVIIQKIMQNETIANSQFGEKDIEEKLQKATEDEKNKPYTQEEIMQKIEEIEKEIESDAGNFPTRNRR